MRTSFTRNIKTTTQAGFTLIELIVVIVILGILAATALPKFADLGADARVAKMQAAAGSLKSGAALFHAQWLVAGSPTATAVSQEGTAIPYANGYPDVGGDGPAAGTATSTTGSGIVLSANLASGTGGDYVLAATATVLTVTPDASHANCVVTYTEAPANGTPIINTTAVTTANCK